MRIVFCCCRFFVSLGLPSLDPLARPSLDRLLECLNEHSATVLLERLRQVEELLAEEDHTEATGPFVELAKAKGLTPLIRSGSLHFRRPLFLLFIDYYLINLLFFLFTIEQVYF